jgi:pSer/pThr/pTyr-binding forkhead associated (FHA) protein
MATRLVALDEGPDILLDRSTVVVGRHPTCDARFDSLRVSRRHCCLTLEDGEIVVRDLGSTNGIRINGEQVEIGRLRIGDELSIAHHRFRVESGPDREPPLDPPQSPVFPRPRVPDLLSPQSRILFVSRN